MRGQQGQQGQHGIKELRSDHDEARSILLMQGYNKEDKNKGAEQKVLGNRNSVMQISLCCISTIPFSENAQ